MADVTTQETLTTRETWRPRSEAAEIPLWRLAILTEVAPATVYAYARGARRPPLEWLVKVERVLTAQETPA
jgi:hypothetical protein